MFVGVALGAVALEAVTDRSCMYPVLVGKQNKDGSVRGWARAYAFGCVVSIMVIELF